MSAMSGRSPRSAGWLLAGSGLAVALRRRFDRLRRTPEDVRDARAGRALGQALRRRGGVYAELGLELTVRSELASTAFRSALAGGLATGEPLPFAVVQQVLERELGAAHRHYSWIDPLPLEHSAVAQVHRARLHDGPLVEIRIRPPSLEPERVRTDLRRLRRAAPILQRWLAPASARPLLDDLERTVEEATDLARTGQRAAQLAAELRHDRAAVVPDVCWPATARGVLTLEWVPRFPLGAATAQGLKTDDCLATLLRIYAPRLLSAGAFHTRPPEGSVWLVNESVPDEALPGGQARLLVLDFAMSRSLPEPLRRETGPLLRAVAGRSAPELRGVLDRLAGVRRGREAGVDQALTQLLTSPDLAPVELLAGLLGDASRFELPPELPAWARSLGHIARMCRALDPTHDPTHDPLPALLAHCPKRG